MSDLHESGLELVVIEGQGKDTRYPLRDTRVTLGRHEPGDEPSGDHIRFPDPTVSRTHAALEWNPGTRNYALVHLSTTNATVVNGLQVTASQVVHPGDKIKMGYLTVQVCRTGAQPAAGGQKHFESPLNLLVLTGAERGRLEALASRRLLIRNPHMGSRAFPEIHLKEMGEANLQLLNRDGPFRIKAQPADHPISMRDFWPGVVRDMRLHSQVSPVLEEGCLVQVGELGLAFVHNREAEDWSRQVTDGTKGHPLEGLRESSYEFQLRALSGPLLGSRLLIDPEELEGSIYLGPQTGTGPSLEVPGEGAVEIEWTFQGAFLQNNDPVLELPFNHEELAPMSRRQLLSGDTFKLGGCNFQFDNQEIHRQLERFYVRLGNEEIPLEREISTLGSGTDCHLADARLEPLAGEIRVTAKGEVLYRTGEGAEERLVPHGKPFAVGNGVEIVLIVDGMEPEAPTPPPPAEEPKPARGKTKAPAKNSPCPCGSGKKYKDCCGKPAS